MHVEGPLRVVPAQMPQGADRFPFLRKESAVLAPWVTGCGRFCDPLRPAQGFCPPWDFHGALRDRGHCTASPTGVASRRGVVGPVPGSSPREVVAQAPIPGARRSQMLRSPVKLALSALAVVLSCSQSAPNGSSNGGNAAIAGALDAASVAAIRGQALRISVVGTQAATQADASGRFSLSGLPAGTAGVRFQAPGIDSTLQIRGLVPGQTMRIAVRIDGRTVTVVAGENQATLVGTIDAIGTGTLTISGLAIAVNDQTAITARGATIAFTDLKVNQIVSVQGTIASGAVTANAVNVLLPANFDQILLQGPIDSIASLAFVVSGLNVTTDPNTRFRRGITFADLKVGDQVVVQGTLQADGSVLANIVRDLAAEAGHAVEIEGAITAITPPDRFVVRGTTIAVNADTRIVGEGHHRGPGSHDLRLITGRSRADHGDGDDDDDQTLTFADLKVGDDVEVEGIAQADGSVLALRVEVENDDEGHDD